jgi:hypothetical protein
VVQSGSSTSPELHKLIREIKLYEIHLGCRLESLHVPGDLMIDVGPDGLSRGIWLSPERHTTTSALASQKVLEAVPYSAALGRWVVAQAGLSVHTPVLQIKGVQDWTFDNVCGRVSVWTPAPEVARQALRFFLDAWVESPWNSAGLFIIPRVLQREWAFLSKHIREVIVIYPHALPRHLQ